jgi:uncharacterized protein (DUF1778 family)
MARKRQPRTPKVPEGPPHERIELQVQPGWTDRIDAAAWARGLSRAAWIRQAILDALKAEEKDGGPKP